MFLPMHTHFHLARHLCGRMGVGILAIRDKGRGMSKLLHLSGFLAPIALGGLSICSPAVSQDTGWYIRQQQKEECERLGGRYSYPKCLLPPPASGDGQNGRPYGRLHHKGVGWSCTYDILIAYVPLGGSTYTVEGWWHAKPSPTDFWDFKINDKYVVPNSDYPIYYYIKWTDKQRKDNLPKDRNFEYEGGQYAMSQIKTGMYEGMRWIEIVCYD